ncbi:MAG: hypothetical protein IJ267_07155 [Bacteroidales bacterium]|nr:hypothetical protein [Bacteroidales bacterium]
MKNLNYKFSFIIVALLVLLSGNIQELRADGVKAGHPQPQHPSYEEIQMQKIAFFTAELQLTPQEAEKFWPLYNELWNERGKARKETMEALKNLKNALESQPEKGDSEIKKLSDIYLANYTVEGELMSDYFDKFLKIIPVKKAAKILYAEEKFRRMLIKQLRHHPHKESK